MHERLGERFCDMLCKRLGEILDPSFKYALSMF